MVALGFLGAGCGFGDAVPVGATLQDGQVLVGEISTATLQLDGALGVIEIPLDDVGLLVPVEGATLGDSHGNVDVWLRNGSELRGRWTDPKLDMAITVGGGAVSVGVPTDDLQALQLRGSEDWSSGPVYRVRTTHGDDFLVDPKSTQVHLENELGSFAPFLSECASIGPVGAPDGDWRVVLSTGTVLVGKVSEDALTFSLPLGPDEVEVPLTSLVSLTGGGWGPRQEVNAAPASVALGSGSAVVDEAGAGSLPPAPVRGRPTLSAADGWFDNARMYDAKR